MEAADAAVPVPALPDDVVEIILGRLLAHSLATSRCVCKSWRDLVDDRNLLQRLRHLLPHTVTGILANYIDHGEPHFFAHPNPTPTSPSSSSPASPQIDGKFSYVVRDKPYPKVADHCNGLVLYQDDDAGGELYVSNPATRRWARLPRLTAGEAVWRRRAFLAFSPAVSRHYQVLLSPVELEPVEAQRRLRDSPAAHPAGDTEWPPARWTWHVFSSRSGRWRERVFVRDGGEAAAGVVGDLRMDSLSYSSFYPRWRFAVHRRGAMYVHCRGEYVSRMSLSAGESSYHVIKSPIDRSEHYKDVKSFLGKSQGEVYFVAINTRRLRIWTLNDHESRTQQHDPTTGAGSEWILKHDRVLRPDDWWGVVADDCYHRIQCDGPWILDDYYKYRKDQWKLDWSFDCEDNVIHRNADSEEEEEEEEYVYPETFDFVGFHPYREVIFLATCDVVVAYHFNTSKVQFLGILKPAEYNRGLYDSFVYTPCHDLRHRG